MNRFRPFACFAVCLLWAAASFAAEPPSAPANAAGQPSANKQSSFMPAGLGGGGPIEVTAQQSLEWHQNERMYLAKGQAKAARGDVTISAEELAAYERVDASGKHEIYRLAARDNVRIQSKEHVIEGDEGTYDADKRLAVLTGKNLRFTDSKAVVTASDAMEYWQDKLQAVARGHAVAIRDDRRVAADMLIAQFRTLPNGTMELQQLTAEGHVVITTKGDVVRGDRGVYDMNRNSAVLSGNVKVTRGQSQMEGAVAEVDMNTGLSRMTAAGKDNRIRALFLPGSEAGAPQLP